MVRARIHLDSVKDSLKRMIVFWLWVVWCTAALMLLEGAGDAESYSTSIVSLTLVYPHNQFIEKEELVEFSCRCDSCSGESPAEFYFRNPSDKGFGLINPTLTSSNYRLIGNNTLMIEKFREPQEGNYRCAISGIYSETLSLIMTVYPVLHTPLPLQNYSLEEGDSLKLFLSFMSTQKHVWLTLTKDEKSSKNWTFDASPQKRNLTYIDISSASLNDAGLYALEMSYGKTKETWGFRIDVKRVFWLHPTCVALTSSSVQVQWDQFSSPRPDESHDDHFWIIVRTDFGNELANVSASTGQSRIIIPDLRGCGRYVIETVGSQDKRSSSSVSCNRTTQELESGKFAEDVEKRIVYVGDDGRIMRVCLPPHYVDNAENESILCQKFKELGIVLELPTQKDGPFVELPSLEIDVTNFTLTDGFCISSCSKARTLNLAKCKPNHATVSPSPSNEPATPSPQTTSLPTSKELSSTPSTPFGTPSAEASATVSASGSVTPSPQTTSLPNGTDFLSTPFGALPAEGNDHVLGLTVGFGVSSAILLALIALGYSIRSRRNRAKLEASACTMDNDRTDTGGQPSGRQSQQLALELIEEVDEVRDKIDEVQDQVCEMRDQLASTACTERNEQLVTKV